MSVVSGAVVAKLRDELRFIFDRTLSLAAATPFHRLPDPFGELVAELAPSPEATAEAKSLDERLQRWCGTTMALLRRYALTTSVDVAYQVKTAGTFVRLQRRTPAGSLTEGRWRRSFRDDLTGIQLQLETVLALFAEAIGPSPPRPPYEPADVHVAACDGDQFRVRLVHGGGEWTGVARLRRVQPNGSLDDAGRALFDLIGGGDLAGPFAAVSAAIGGRGARRWIRLHLADAGTLGRECWELLHDGRGFLAVDPSIAITRAVGSEPGPPMSAVTAPLRLLVTISSPRDLPALNTGREAQLLRDALGGLALLGGIEVDVAEDGTLDALRRHLRAAEEAQRPYGAWHFIGHGRFNEESGHGELAMVGDDGRAQYVGGPRLQGLFRGGHPLRLAVLNACESASGDIDDPRTGVAAALIDCGAAAVVAMQSSISDDAAIVLAQEIYGAVAGGAEILEALSDARRALFCRRDGTEWMTPILFLASQSYANSS